DNKWKLAWIFTGPQRVRHFLRLVLKERLLTNVERCRRGLFGDLSCSLCGNVEESIIHVLRDYGNAREVWKQVIPSRVLLQIFSCPVDGVDFSFIKLNKNGVLDPNLGLASATTVARDDFGTWHERVGRNIDKSCWQLNRDLSLESKSYVRDNEGGHTTDSKRSQCSCDTLAGMMRAFPYGPIMFQETLAAVVGQLRLDVRLMHDGTRIIL
ncbi:hypothetical protein Goari_023279, partial [Gossypium aridum]|nr:hypothetical protein [Gossypium aridum]